MSERLSPDICGYDQDASDAFQATLDKRERVLMALAYEAGRVADVASLAKACGIGATFTAEALRRWRGKQTEYGVETLTPLDMDEIAFKVQRRERNAYDFAPFRVPPRP